MLSNRAFVPLTEKALGNSFLRLTGWYAPRSHYTEQLRTMSQDAYRLKRHTARVIRSFS